MNTLELEEAMLSDDEIRKYFGGVLAADHLPVYVTDRPKIFIVNNSESNFSGTHWVSIFLDKKGKNYCSTFFDSLAKPPLETFEQFLIVNGPKYEYSLKRIQSLYSDTCGMFCLFFAYFICRGYSLKEILEMFKKEDFLYNELLVLFFSNKVFNKNK